MMSRTVTASSAGSWSWRAHVVRFGEGARAAMRAIETRRELAELDARVLSDIGVNRWQAEREARRAPWDLEPVRTRPNLAFGGPGTVARQTSVPPRASPGLGAFQSGPRSGRSPWQAACGHWAASRQWMAEALRRRRSRQAITELNEFLLKDVGVSRAEAEHEANKPFWR